VQITLLTMDYWEGLGTRTDTVPNPTWQDIRAAIERLDGRQRTLVTLSAEGDAHLAIGGGQYNQYVVYATSDNVKFSTLMSADQSHSKVLLFIGGQEGDYQKDIVVDFDGALAAAKFFADHGRTDPSLQWRTD
jgi:Immunity protein Imm1